MLCQAFVWYDTDYRIVLCCLHRIYFIVSVIPKEGLAVLVPALPALPSFGYDNDKDLKACFSVTRLFN